MTTSQQDQLPSSSAGLYLTSPTQSDSQNREKVTISINASLLNAIDEHVHRTGVNRSAVFEQALLVWYRWQQEQADIAYYSSLTDKDKAADAAWTKITTEAARHIWKNERKKVSKKR
jgi:metal-responsive CopG/Arc/MetJ family transcriptional regulator